MANLFLLSDETLHTSGSYKRSICVDYMYYNPYGIIQKIKQTKEGVLPVVSDHATKAKKKSGTK